MAPDSPIRGHDDMEYGGPSEASWGHAWPRN